MNGINVMSLDSSTTCIGYSIWEEDNLICYGKLKPNLHCEDWTERIQNLSFQVQNLITEYNVKKIIQEDVPLIGRQNMVLVQLGAVKGMILTVAYINKIEVDFISVGTWRKNIGISCGGKERDEMKVKSIQKANELFNINLSLVFTKNGNYNPNKSDDDISDSILIYCSTRDKYKVKKGFGRR